MATADPLIGFLIDRLYNYLDEKVISGFFGFEKEYDKMKKSFSNLKSFLVDLQKPTYQHVRNGEIYKTNVVSLRDLINEADDILLDCQLRADYLKETKPLITSLRGNLFRYETKKRLEKINGKITEIEETFRTYFLPLMFQQKTNLQERSTNCASSSSSRWTTPFNQFEIVGLIKDLIRIKGWILAENNELQRIAIVGMGGLGKTTLAQKVFNDKQVSSQFMKRIWVSVSQHVDVVNIMRSILDQLQIKDHRADSIRTTLLQTIKEALKGTTYLIIMDDVWSIEHGWWNQLLDGLTQDDQHNSCIIITTRNEEVAKNMGVGELRIHKPKLLGDKDSWSLLCKVAFSSSKGVCNNPELQDVGKNIVKKCGGLPLAIKAIAGLLSTKSGSLSEWQKIHEDFHHKLADITAANDGSVISSLQLSYEDLPSHLKQCILSFSIYPEDFEIRTEQLVYWWAGEGFVGPGNNRKTTKQLAYECLYELFSRCLIEPIKSWHTDRLFECKIHDMVRDLIIRVAKQEAFSSFDDDNKQIFDKDTRHFGIVERFPSIQQTEVPNSKIRAMVITNRNGPPVDWKLDTTSLPKVDTLRVLDLYTCDIKRGNEFLGWLKSQKRLAYLNLYGAHFDGEPTLIIKNLRNLQFLKIDGKYLNSVSSLQKLRLLSLPSNYRTNPKYPEGLANLINLEELSGILLGRPSNRGGPGGDCRLRELISLPKLRVLDVSIQGYPIDAQVLGCETSVISQLGNLQVLTIRIESTDRERIMNLLDQLTPPPSLQELRISGYFETMPAFIKPELLQELRHLTIQGNTDNTNDLTYLSPNFWGEEEKRWNLETLSLICLPKLQLKWETVRQKMPLISYVEVKNVDKFESFPIKAFKRKFGIWRKIDEEDSMTRRKPSSRKRKA